MKLYLQKAYQLLRFNIRPLLVFEIIYRLLGLAIVYPLVTGILYLSVRWTGFEYVVNADFFEYITDIRTILLGLFLLLVFGIYVTYEVVVLSIVFHASHHRQPVGIQSLLIVSGKRLYQMIKSYHIVIITSSMIFLFLVELFHIVGIASTVQIPDYIASELARFSWFRPVAFFLIVGLLVLFIETIFFELQCTIEKPTLKENFNHSRRLLKGNRLKMVISFFIVNGIINVLIYALYLIIIGIVALFVLLFRGESTVYPIILSIIYSVYLIVGLLATIILIPINFAWINAYYYKHKITKHLELVEDVRYIRSNRPFRRTVFYRIISGVTVLLAIGTIIFISFISNNPAKLELLNNPVVVSHRGGGNFGPENTIAGIQQGLDFAADAIEIDVRFTKDGVPVLLHDATLTRTTNDTANTKISDLTYEELAQYDAGSWFDEAFAGEPIPTLDEALRQINFQATIFLELKDSYQGGEEIIVEMLQDRFLVRNVIILSFNQGQLERIKALDDRIETLLLLSSFIGDISVIAGNDRIDNIGFRYELAQGNADRIRILQQAGKEVYIWTINNQDAISEMNSLNVDGIITDYPLLTREVIYSDSTKSEYRKLLETIFSRDIQ
ncbi:glycerophosphodiester phosphodiesterase [Candidatus Xianfuyuplasma coldseepsis]|uniref:GP-PDE domain-containing protein n=1 Tax=Candidatus Xianfuyuplasma coldseepsis TaxID=2782163 RepID=A0A7L7KR77_9MOLU|nr:glycerophosphodiester phosphodiesterase family protein [Xianfuyuplasma coldseepsis]QMS85085.1 hypothetical protein G4Z02_04790 [Xianfuyuplasma coldseepsis]